MAAELQRARLTFPTEELLDCAKHLCMHYHVHALPCACTRLQMQSQAAHTVLVGLAQRPLHASRRVFLQVEMGTPCSGERLQLLEVEWRAGEHAHG